MPAMKGVKVLAHTEEEKIWALEKVNSGITTISQIEEYNLVDELEEKFGRKISSKGMYSWFRYLKNPELKKEEYQRKKESRGSDKHNSRFLREKETFEKSNILAYISEHVVGFENDSEFKEFMMKNQVIGDSIFVFKKTPIKIKYDVMIGEE